MRKLLLGLALICGSVFAAGVQGPGANQNANTVLAGPTSGAPAQPQYRVLVTADFPSNVINGASIQNTSVDLTAKVTGTLPIANGGTGGATKTIALDNLSPATTLGDILVFNGTDMVRQGTGGAGNDNYVLTADHTQANGIKWAPAGTGTPFSGVSSGTNTTAAMVVGTGSTLTTSGSGTITANAYNGTNNINASTALTNKVPLANGGTNADLSGTGGAHNLLFQSGVGSAITVNTLAEGDLPATTAFTDTTNTFTTVQNFNNYICLQSVSPAQITSDQTGFNPGAGSYVRINSDALRNIQGIVNGVNGRVIDFINVGSSNIVLANQNASATAANRIITPSGSDMTLSPNYGAELVYDSTDSRWRIVNIYQVGGGTGLTVPNGTSGGVPYYSGTGTIGTSALLTQNALILGGGTGNPPVAMGSLGTTTTVLHGNAAGAPTFGQIATADIAANAVDMSSKMTGTMQAAQFPVLTGDVTTPGGSLATTIANSAVTTAKIAANAVDLTTKVTNTLGLGNGGTGATTQQGAMDAIAGSTTSGSYLRGNGTHVVMSTIQAGDVPTLNQNTTGTASNVTGTVAIANGGSGQTTQTAAFDALAPTATTKGTIAIWNGTHWVILPPGADTTVLTMDSTQTVGAKWGAAGGATVIAPMTINGASVQLGTCVAATTTDANASINIGSAGTTKKVMVWQTVATNTAPAIEVQKSDGTVQWNIDNSTNSRADITEKIQTANQANMQIQTISENVTIAAAATSTSATNLLPANSFILGVTCRVTTVVPTASTFTVGVSGQATLFMTGVSTVNGTTGSSIKQSPPLSPFCNQTATQILITPNVTPAAGTGTVRVTVMYITLQEPQN